MGSFWMRALCVVDCRSPALMYFSGDTASCGILGYSITQYASKAHLFLTRGCFFLAQSLCLTASFPESWWLPPLGRHMEPFWCQGWKSNSCSTNRDEECLPSFSVLGIAGLKFLTRARPGASQKHNWVVRKPINTYLALHL